MLFPGDGEIAREVHAKHWEDSLLGPVGEWPAELRAAFSICLNSNFPMAITWGPDLVYLYNDAAIPIFGRKHPRALGRRACDVWPEAWGTFGPMLQSVLADCKAVWRDNLQLVLERNGFAEECYFTFSYSPILTADCRAGGVFVTVMETSEQVLGQRRQRTLAELTNQVALHAQSAELLDKVRDALAGNLDDLPLSALYIAGNAGKLELAFATGLAEPGNVSHAVAQAMEDMASRCLVEGAVRQYAADALANAGWRAVAGPGLPRELLCVPLGQAGKGTEGVLLFGVNPRKALDAAGRAFYNGVAAHVAHALATARAQHALREAHAELERRVARRTEALRLLYERLQTVREGERTNLAREVHDQLGQILSAAKIDIKLLEDDLRSATPPPVPNIITELGHAGATLERAIELVRDIATRLRPPDLDGPGLYAAIEWHARDFERRTRISCHLTLDQGRAQPTPVGAAALLRIFQEALTNVLRHAQAGEVRVALERRGASLVLRVLDDGVGIGRGRLRAGGSLGLQGMRERARLAGGALLVGPLARCGTLVSARVPLARTKGAS